MTAIEIIAEVASKYGVTVEQIRGRHKPRLPQLRRARQEAVQRLRAERSLSNNQIGIVLGWRDPSTISTYATGMMEQRVNKLRQYTRR
jgi:chromosomal replication initiation ATPase DnaA